VVTTVLENCQAYIADLYDVCRRGHISCSWWCYVYPSFLTDFLWGKLKLQMELSAQATRKNYKRINKKGTEFM